MKSKRSPSEPPLMPEDLELDVGSPRRATWEGVLQNAQTQLAQAQQTVEIQVEVIMLATKIIAVEKEKFK